MPPSMDRILHFQKILTDRHFTAIIRKSKGRDILAACGQLKGAFESKFIPEIANEFNIEIKQINGSVKLNFSKQTIFFIVKWDNDPGQVHCVRFVKQDNKNIYFMNPKTGEIEYRTISEFNSWVLLPLLITKNHRLIPQFGVVNKFI